MGLRFRSHASDGVLSPEREVFSFKGLEEAPEEIAEGEEESEQHAFPREDQLNAHRHEEAKKEGLRIVINPRRVGKENSKSEGQHMVGSSHQPSRGSSIEAQIRPNDKENQMKTPARRGEEAH